MTLLRQTDVAASFRAALDAAPFNRAQALIVSVAIVAMISDGFDMQAMANVAPMLIGDGLVGRATMAYIFSAGTLGLTIGTIGFGQLADRVGSKRVIICCTLVFGACTLLLSIVRAPSAFIALRFLSGLGLGGVMPSAIALVSGYIPERSRILAVSLVVAGFAFGGSLGGFLSAFLIPTFGWPSVFLLGGIVPVGLVPLLLVALPESLPLLQRRGDRDALIRAMHRVLPDWTPISHEQRTAPDAAAPIGVGRLFTLEYRRVTILFWCCYFANLLLLYFLGSWLPTMISFTGRSIAFANVAVGIYQISGIVGSFALGWLGGRFRPSYVLCGIFLCSVAALLTVSATGHDPVYLILGSFSAGFCVVGGQGVLNGFLSTVYPPDVRGTAQGWAVGVGRIGSIVGPLIGGLLLAAAWTPPEVFRLCICASLAAAVAVVTIRKPSSVAGPRVGDAPVGLAS